MSQSSAQEDRRKVQRSGAGNADTELSDRNEINQDQRTGTALLLSALLPHLPSTACSLSLVQELAHCTDGRRCVALTFMAYVKTKELLHRHSHPRTRHAGGEEEDRKEEEGGGRRGMGKRKGRGHGVGEGEGNEEEAEKEAIEYAREICACSWKAIHAHGSRWRGLDSRWREAYGVGCMLRGVLLLIQSLSASSSNSSCRITVPEELEIKDEESAATLALQHQLVAWLHPQEV